jgi:glycosyltransferase involved in cell wall biosynthesis
MAAGCVPVVVNKGGQPEIVEHGKNGFVWNTLDELKAYSRAHERRGVVAEDVGGRPRTRSALFAGEVSSRDVAARGRQRFTSAMILF